MNDFDTPRYVGPGRRERKEKMTPAEIKARFDRETAACYSQRQPAWLPEFEYAFSLVSAVVREVVPAGGTILDLGAGTGNLTRMVLEKSERISAVLLDFSPNMLSEVDNVLASFPGRYRTMTADFASAALGREAYQAVISSFAIHHLRTDSDYLALYRKIHAALTVPGIFVCVDVVSGSHELFTGQNEEEWRRFLAGKGFPPSEIDRILSNYHIEDSPRSVGLHLSLLQKAGFSTADVLWKRANFAVYAGLAGETSDH
jgi:tRNA (cmo5U34)-methyltransferase